MSNPILLRARLWKNAEELERQIVRFTNIDKESFTHSFRGISITIQAGESYVGRLPECDHLATHLARKILSREKKKNISHDKTVVLWNDKEVYELKTKILSSVGTETQTRYSAEEARERDLKALRETYEPPKVETPAEIQVTKKDIIKDLESRGLKVDTNKSKEELLQQLLEAEAQGIEPKE